LRGRVCLPALGSLPITRTSEQDACFADGDHGSAPNSHYVRECAERENEIAALALLRGADFLSVFDQPQRQALAMQFLNLHGEGFVVAGIFWGLWLFPFGILLFKSGFLPRLLGVLLIAACFGYLADSLTSLLLPSYEHVVSQIADIPLTLGEPAIILWLLIRGARDQPLEAAA
jgi:Domain of unknown function (DUF4386)